MFYSREALETIRTFPFLNSLESDSFRWASLPGAAVRDLSLLLVRHEQLNPQVKLLRGWVDVRVRDAASLAGLEARLQRCAREAQHLTYEYEGVFGRRLWSVHFFSPELMGELHAALRFEVPDAPESARCAPIRLGFLLHFHRLNQKKIELFRPISAITRRQFQQRQGGAQELETSALQSEARKKRKISSSEEFLAGVAREEESLANYPQLTTRRRKTVAQLFPVEAR